MATAPDTQTQVNRRSSRQRGSNSRQSKDETQRRRATHLEFTQAMEDFKTMFPDIDSDVIEAVLRANKGAVDTTIDHLLTLSVDIGMCKEISVNVTCIFSVLVLYRQYL